MKLKAFFIIFEGLSLKQYKNIFFEYRLIKLSFVNTLRIVRRVLPLL